MAMNDDRIKQLRALCEAATPGPWHYDDEGARWPAPLWYSSVILVADGAHVANNANLIAEARTALPEALDEVERLRAYATRGEHRAMTLLQAIEDCTAMQAERDEARRIVVAMWESTAVCRCGSHPWDRDRVCPRCAGRGSLDWRFIVEAYREALSDD